MHGQLWGYKVQEKIYLGVCERERLNVTGLEEWDGLAQLVIFVLNAHACIWAGQHCFFLP